MTNLVEVQYAQTGKSSNTDALGMREMQAMVYAQRHRKHLLVKAPPASGFCTRVGAGFPECN